MKKINTVLVVIKDRLALRAVVTLLDERGVETIIAESFYGMAFGLDKYPVDAIVLWPYLEFDIDETVKFLRKLPERGFEGVVVVVDARPEDREILFHNGVKHEISSEEVHKLVSIFGIGAEKGEANDAAESGFID